MLFFEHVKCQSLDTFLLTNYCTNGMTFLPANSEDGQIFICGIFCFFGIACWHFLAFGIGRGIFW